MTKRTLAACAATMLVLITLACQDSLTVPNASEARRTLVLEAGTTVVAPDNMHGWGFYNDQQSVACTSLVDCRLVAGPTTPPLGGGSAELAVSAATQGNALILPGLGGTRLSSITELSYSTYRQSPATASPLAIALQLNVDFDLNDASAGYQGRLVYEPYLSGQPVTAASWQSWDTRAGRWWGTKASVSANGVTTANPCVQSSPCTWSELLTRFPNLGIHASYGAIVLKAGSGWGDFRGNVDALRIGVDSVLTTYDFEAVQSRGFRLQIRSEGGVIASPGIQDTVLPPGTVVPFSFDSWPGHDTVIVVLDDTLAARTGAITMDRDHVFDVSADTLYSIAGMSSDGKAISQRITNLLNATNKTSAYSNLMDYVLGRLYAGADEAALARDNELAWYLTVDPQRDSAQLEAVHAALNGWVFAIKIAPTFAYSSPERRISTSLTATPGSTGVASMSLSPRTEFGFRSALSPDVGSRSLLPGQGINRAVVSAEVAASPTEPVRVTYVNGIWTNEKDVTQGTGAYFTSAHLASLFRTQQRFLNQKYTTFDYVYNASRSSLMADYDQQNTCVQSALHNLGFQMDNTIETQYAACLGMRFNKAVVSEDLVRMLVARHNLKMHLTPTDAQVQKVVEYVNTYRNGVVGSPQHILVVAHSYGNAVVAEAMRRLPQREGHALNFATGCLASLSLASVVDRSSFDVEDPYKLGFHLQGDIALNLNPTGWDLLSTPETDAIAAKLVGREGDLLAQFNSGIQIHSVDRMYLGATLARQKVVNLATTLHKECLQGELTLDPSSVTVAPGSEFTIRPVLKNQNGRRLYGRKYSWSNVAASAWINNTPVPSDSAEFRFRVSTPTTGSTWAVDTWPYYVLHETVTITVPPGEIGPGSYVSKDTSWYELVTGTNGGLGDAGVVQPEGDWDGSATCPSTLRRVYGYGQAYGDYQLHCDRRYMFYRGSVTDPVLVPQIDHYEWQLTAPDGTSDGFTTGGDSVSVSCDGTSYCVGAMTVRAVNANRTLLAISDPILVSGGTSPSPYRAPNAARAPSPSLGSRTLGARKLAP